MHDYSLFPGTHAVPALAVDGFGSRENSPAGPFDTQPAHVFGPSSRLANRLAKGAALLGCALACVQETSAQAYSLGTGTISNFWITATSGNTTGNFFLAGPSTGFNAPLSITPGGYGSGAAVAWGLGYFDLVGFVITDPTPNNVGSASGSFTMNFTASVLFYDFTNLIGYPLATTSWSETTLGILTNGQAFNPGTPYTFNFTTTRTGISEDYLTLAAFIDPNFAPALPIPETSTSSFAMGTAVLLLTAGSLRRRRSRSRYPSASEETKPRETSMPE